MLGEAFAICVFGVFFLKPPRVGQQYLQQIGRCRGCINPADESIANKPGEVARVVDVSVSQQHPRY